MSGATYETGPECTPSGDIEMVERAVSAPAIESLVDIKRQQDEPQRGDLIAVTETETVEGQHQRDGVIHRVELVGGRYFRLRCRAMSEGKHPYMRVAHQAEYLAYVFAFDAAEAWAYRGEIPTMADGRAIRVESR